MGDLHAQNASAGEESSVVIQVRRDVSRARVPGPELALVLMMGS
ncbi:MAG: hypothetical protein Q7R41_18465 [Phycisphaerales bacterium]|nr:hypothetical protein [Phycisphaerales bacterium]